MSTRIIEVTACGELPSDNDLALLVAGMVLMRWPELNVSVTVSEVKPLADSEPNSAPEDVQLDVELSEAVQALLDIGKRDLTNPKYDGYFEALKLALLRRVSGKGAQACKYSPSGQHVAPRGICQYCEEYVPSPSPVPATPAKRMMVAPSTGLVHEYCPDCRGVCSEYGATTQGTPEGAK